LFSSWLVWFSTRPSPAKLTGKARGGLGELVSEFDCLRNVVSPYASAIIRLAIVFVELVANVDAGNAIAAAVAEVFNDVARCCPCCLVEAAADFGNGESCFGQFFGGVGGCHLVCQFGVGCVGVSR